MARHVMRLTLDRDLPAAPELDLEVRHPTIEDHEALAELMLDAFTDTIDFDEGDDLDAARAHELGLVNAVVPADQLMEEALRWAGKIAANAPLAVRAIKRLYRHGLTEDFSSHSHHVLMQLMLLFRSNDFQEGMQAFLERRPPRFSGR